MMPTCKTQHTTMIEYVTFASCSSSRQLSYLLRQWTEILPRSNLGPDSRHLFKVPATPCVNYVKIHMHPDGGIVSPLCDMKVNVRAHLVERPASVHMGT